jgi:hypothetical protein
MTGRYTPGTHTNTRCAHQPPLHSTPPHAHTQGMAISFAGHNVKMQLSYLEADDPAANDALSDRELAGALASLDAKDTSALRQWVDPVGAAA